MKSPLMSKKEIKISDNVMIDWYEGGRYKHVSLDGMIVALCPSVDTALTVARALKQSYSIEQLKDGKPT